MQVVYEETPSESEGGDFIDCECGCECGAERPGAKESRRVAALHSFSPQTLQARRVEISRKTLQFLKVADFPEKLQF